MEKDELQELGEAIRIRREKLAALVAEGRDPFKVVKFDKNAESADIKEKYSEYEGKEVKIAGRMIAKRVMGKASFAKILDFGGSIQIYVSRDDLGDEAYAEFKKSDIGDVVGVTGMVFTTKTGEISVHARSIQLLAKSLMPLPEKYHGLKDTDTRYRQRYVDLIANPDVKEVFVKRSRIISCIRSSSIPGDT